MKRPAIIYIPLRHERTNITGKPLAHLFQARRSIGFALLETVEPLKAFSAMWKRLVVSPIRLILDQVLYQIQAACEPRSTSFR
jgi:hypothetical protein